MPKQQLCRSSSTPFTAVYSWIKSSWEERTAKVSNQTLKKYEKHEFFSMRNFVLKKAIEVEKLMYEFVAPLS